jgi:hypothetical protein
VILKKVFGRRAKYVLTAGGRNKIPATFDDVAVAEFENLGIQ